MDAKDVKLNDNIVRIYNPDTEPFTCRYDGVEYTIKDLDFAEFPQYIADHIAKHLADKLYLTKAHRTNHDDDIAEIMKGIYV